MTSSVMSVFSLDSFSCFSSSVWAGLDGDEELAVEFIACAGDVKLLLSLSLLYLRLLGISGGSDEWLECDSGSIKSNDFFRDGNSSDLPSGWRGNRAWSGLNFTGMLGRAFVGLVSEFERDVVRGLISGGVCDCRMDGLGGESTDFEDFSSFAFSWTLLVSALLTMTPVPGTVRMMSHRLMPADGEERDLLKCDVQFFCFSISSLELNFLSGFSGFSGFSAFIRDTFWIIPMSFFPTPLLIPTYFFFGDGVRCLSGLGSFKLSSLLVECLMLKVVGRRPSPSFSNRARALLNRAACDSVRITAFPPGLSFNSLSSSNVLRWKMLAICDTFAPGNALFLSMLVDCCEVDESKMKRTG